MAEYTIAEGFPHIPLTAGMQIKLEAVSPTTGAAVTGVTSSRWAIYGDDESDSALGIEDVVPLLTAQAGQ